MISTRAKEASGSATAIGQPNSDASAISILLPVIMPRALADSKNQKQQPHLSHSNQAPVRIQPLPPNFSRYHAPIMSSLIPALERGKACVECRRRKQKCDGTLPTCNVCTRTSRSCRYEKPVVRPVSVVLQERLRALEEKLRSLTLAPTEDPRGNSVSQPQELMEARTRLPMEMSGRWWEAPVLPPAVHRYLFDIFADNAERVHYYFHIPTFIERMASKDPQDHPHPGLLNAVYLMACYFSSLESVNSLSLAAHETLFLARAQTALTDSLSLSDRLLDFVRGSNLVAAFLFARGRLLEGYHVHCGTARFTLSCGLHRISSHFPDRTPAASGTTITLLPPPKSLLEQGERLLVFWQCYWLDKVGCLLMGYAPALPVQASLFRQFGLPVRHDEDITSTLPRTIEDYETGNVSDLDNQSLENALYDTYPPERREDSYFAMYTKATGALWAANRLGKLYRADKSPEVMRALRDLHESSDRFAASLPAVASVDPGATDDESLVAGSARQLSIVSVRTILLGAILEMNNATADVDPQAYNARLTSASYISALVFHFGEDSYKEADLPTGFCWCLAAEVLIQHVRRVQSPSSPENATASSSNSTTTSLIECESQLARLLTALEKLSVVFPTLVHQVQHVRVAVSTIGSSSSSSSGAFSNMEIHLGD